MPARRMNSLKSRAMNCGPLSLMIRGFSPGYFSNARCTIVSTSRFGHALANLPVHDVAAVTVQHAGQVVERPGHVDVGNVDVPVLVGASGCTKPVPFFDGENRR